MKELYFCDDTFSQNAKNLFSELTNLSRIRHTDFIDENTALIITDMQNYFLEENSHAFIPSAPATLKYLNNLIKKFEKLDLPVIFTRHINTKANSNQMGVWWQEIIKKGLKSQLTDKLKAVNPIIINKTQYDSFYKTKLNSILKDKKIKNIIVGGVMTHLCTETTIRSAFVHGYSVSLALVGTATYNKSFHLNTAVNLSHGFASIFFDLEDMG